MKEGDSAALASASSQGRRFFLLPILLSLLFFTSAASSLRLPQQLQRNGLADSHFHHIDASYSSSNTFDSNTDPKLIHHYNQQKSEQQHQPVDDFQVEEDGKTEAGQGRQQQQQQQQQQHSLDTSRPPLIPREKSNEVAADTNAEKEEKEKDTVRKKRECTQTHTRAHCLLP